MTTADFNDMIFDSSSFKKVRKLGHGGFGQVILVTEVKTGREFAKKKVFTAEQDDDQLFMREARTIKKLQHPCTLPLYGVIMAKLPGDCPCLITPFMKNGSLGGFLKQEKLTDPIQRTRLAKAVVGCVCGMRYVHAQGIVH